MQKAKVLYDAIAGSNGFYSSPVDAAARSMMNVPFTIPANADLEKEFVSQAAKHSMVSNVHTLNPLGLTLQPFTCARVMID